MNDSDVHDFAAALRDLADMLERPTADPTARDPHNSCTALKKALKTAASWRGSVQATAYDSSRGNRTEEVDGQVVAIPHDPTGEAVIGPAPDKLIHLRLQAAVGRIKFGMGDLFLLVPATTPLKAKDRAADNDPGEGWCSSCWRIRWLSPEHQHPDGRAKHKALCSWCASFRADQGQLPPEALLRKRRDGRRITEADVARALGKVRAS